MNCDMTGNPVGINAGGKINDTTFFANIGATRSRKDTIYKTNSSNRSGLTLRSPAVYAGRCSGIVDAQQPGRSIWMLPF